MTVSFSVSPIPGAERGNVQITLTSPSGTRSVLLQERVFDFGDSYIDWPLMSVHFWGEDPTTAGGQWTLRISYNEFSDIDTQSVDLTDLSVTFYGTTEVPEAVQQIPDVCDPACVRGCAAAGPEFCDQCLELRNATSLVCIAADECPQEFAVRSGYCYDPSLSEPQCSPGTSIHVRTGFVSIALCILIALYV